jgi:recombinational DNA repair ATPase RecF
MSSVIAEGVLAATHKLVQQAMTGQWQDVPKTVQERRELLNNLSASASPQDQQWLGALQQAMAESDAAVAQMAANAPTIAPATLNASQGSAEATDSGVTDTPNTAAVDSMMEMLKKSR